MFHPVVGLKDEWIRVEVRLLAEGTVPVVAFLGTAGIYAADGLKVVLSALDPDTGMSL